MTRLTRDTIGKLLDSQAIGNFSSLASLNKKDNSDLNKLPLANNHNYQKNIQIETNKNSDIFVKKHNLKNGNTNMGSLETKDISINHSENKVFEGIISEATNSSLSVRDPLAAMNYEQTLDILSTQSLAKIAQQAIVENENPICDGNNYAKSENHAYKILNQKIQKESVSNPLANNFIPSNSAYNSVSLNMADTLAGKGLTLVMYLIDLCKQNCSLVTPPVFTKDLLQVVSIKPAHLRNLILRLSEKKIFKVLLHKSSKHALRVFEFEKNTYTSLTKRKFNLIENIHNIDSFDVKDNEHSKSLAKPFKNIDLSSLESVGFNETHLIQIHKEYEKNPNKILSEEILQHSIDAFAFDLKHNHITERFKSSPAIVLLSLLKKGMPYSSRTPDKFLTPQQEALQNYLSNKQKKIEAQEEQESKLKEIEFIEWQDRLTEQEINSIIGDKVNSLVGSKIMKEKSIRSWLVQHFDSEIWPVKRKQIIEQIQNSCKVD